MVVVVVPSLGEAMFFSLLYVLDLGEGLRSMFVVFFMGLGLVGSFFATCSR